MLPRPLDVSFDHHKVQGCGSKSTSGFGFFGLVGLVWSATVTSANSQLRRSATNGINRANPLDVPKSTHGSQSLPRRSFRGKGTGSRSPAAAICFVKVDLPT